MSLFQAISLVVALVALFGCLNSRVVRLPDIIGITGPETGSDPFNPLKRSGITSK